MLVWRVWVPYWYIGFSWDAWWTFDSENYGCNVHLYVYFRISSQSTSIVAYSSTAYTGSLLVWTSAKKDWLCWHYSANTFTQHSPRYAIYMQWTVDAISFSFLLASYFLCRERPLWMQNWPSLEASPLPPSLPCPFNHTSTPLGWADIKHQDGTV